MTQSTSLQRRSAVTLISAALLFMASACAKNIPVGETSSSSASGILADTTGNIPLIIRNRSYFDINVYAHRSVGSPGRRVGTVSSGSEGTFSVSSQDLQSGSMLMLGVRAIAGRSAWVSPALAVGGNKVIARLDVNSDANGDLGRSVLYLENK